MPSFATDSALDYRIKKGVVVDVLKTLNLSVRRKRKYKADRARRMTDRLMMKPARATIEGAGDGPGRDRNDKSDGDGISAALAAKRSSLARGEEERKAKALHKKQQADEKEKERRLLMIKREQCEAKLCGDLELIYPKISYEHNFKIDELF